MTLPSLLRLVHLSLNRERREVVSSSFGVAIGVGALVFFVALGVGVGQVFRERVFPVDAAMVDVVPPAISLGSLLGGGKLDASTVRRLASMPEVAAVYPKMNVRVPAVSRYEGDFFGSPLRIGFEVLAQGVEPGLVEGDVELGAFADPGPGKPIPALAATRVLELYNKTFAPARRLPQLSPAVVTGFTFPVEFNRSYVAATAPGPTVAATVQVVGISDRALLAGITIPLDVARRINRDTGVDAETFTAVTLRARDPSAVPRIVEAVKRMGLEVDDQERRMAANAGAAVAITTSALALLSVLICVLAAVNIAHALSAQVRARAREIGVMQAVGASRRDIRSIILGEAGVVGMVGGLAGTVSALLVAWAVDALAAGWLPPFPFKPDTFFAFPAALLAGAFLPSRRAAAMDPARTLAG